MQPALTPKSKALALVVAQRSTEDSELIAATLTSPCRSGNDPDDTAVLFALVSRAGSSRERGADHER
jgi:hypothetical protein